MREAASRGFWMNTYSPYGYRKVHVQDGAKKRPQLERDSPADAVVRRMFDMALRGQSTLDITKTLNHEGIQSPHGKRWLKTSIHRMLSKRGLHRNSRLGPRGQGQRPTGSASRTHSPPSSRRKSSRG